MTAKLPMESALEALVQAWGEARGGAGRLVHLEGLPGCGKSSLLTRFLDQARKRDDRAVVVGARCADALHGGGRGIVEEMVIRVAEGVRAVDLGDAGDNGQPWLLPGRACLIAAADMAELPVDDETPMTRRARTAADLLMDVGRTHPVLLVLDDVRRADVASRQVVQRLASGLRDGRPSRLLVVLAGSSPLEDPAAEPDPGWYPDPQAVLRLEPQTDASTETQARARLARHGEPAESYVQTLVDTAAGNARVLDALVQVSEFAGVFGDVVDDPILAQRPEFAGLEALARGRLVDLGAAIRADAQTAAVLGEQFDVATLASAWAVAFDAAEARVRMLTQTGLVQPDGDRFRFVTAGVAAHLAAALPVGRRRELDTRVAAVLRDTARVRIEALDDETIFDVTQTWSDGHNTMGRINSALDMLMASARHFARAGRLIEAAEAAVSLVEGFFGHGALPQLSVRYLKRADRVRRHQLSAALLEAEGWVRRAARPSDAPPTDELLSVDVRRLAAQARFRASVGDYAAAARDAMAAVTLAGHHPDMALRMQARRVEVEVGYGAGNNAAGRRALVALTQLADSVEPSVGVPVFAWLAELVVQWEWIGLHDRLFPMLVSRLEAAGAAREAVKARVERLAASLAVADPATFETLVDETMVAARVAGQVSFASELLARYAADVMRGLVSRHFDTLSGEFFAPDFDTLDPGVEPLRDQLTRPVRLIDQADALAGTAAEPVGQLRVLYCALHVAFEARERLIELLERWAPIQGAAPPPVRLVEISDLLEHGFFAVSNVESLAERIIQIATGLGLDQITSDTAYELLERGLPVANRDPERFVRLAEEGYERLDDAYGLATLALVAIRRAERDGQDPTPHVQRAEALLSDRADAMVPEQRAFIHLRLGQRLVASADQAAAARHLEGAIRGFDEVGDVDQAQLVGEMLREVYRKLGDLGRYRAMRARFHALEEHPPGVDPLGLEMRIEHLLNLARHEPDDMRAIEMVERCVSLFARLPDGTPRIDECFVEISKICRRRADGAQTESGFVDWLQRSLEAVRTAAAINRSLGNHHRVFEEFHELFDDLLGLQATDEYLRARAESRELAFETGNIDELVYLFEEHLQLEADGAYDQGRLPETQAFFEALNRYICGLGAHDHASRLRKRFAAFLRAVGEGDLAQTYAP